VTPIRAAFFGTPSESIPVLAGLLEVAEVAFVVTRPDAPRGRSDDLVPPPVKFAAESLGLPVLQPVRLAEVLEETASVDVALVAAYGLLVPPSLLRAPKHGFVNLHYSLLPRWRGASPVVRTILAGDRVAGVTLIQMDEGLDTGPIFASAQTPVESEETTGELTARLAGLGGSLVTASLPGAVAGSLVAVAQEDARATAAAKVDQAEAFIDPARHSSAAVHRAVRAFNPKPGAWGLVDGERIKVWAAHRTDESAPAGIAGLADGGVKLGCSDGAVELIVVQPAGRPRMDALAWMNGRRGEPARFESS
jgi:methionyl-tRNA formyltransferase